jgi:hypothetical protein
MKITEDVRRYAAEKGIEEATVIEKGLREKAKELNAQEPRSTPKHEP